MKLVRAILAAALLAAPAAAHAQQEASGGAGDDQAMIDLDALVIATQVSLRCAIHDPEFAYLTPLEATAAEYRLRQMELALRAQVDDLADQMADMRAEAGEIECGHEGLVPFMDFGRQVAADLTDTALLAWRTLRVRRCAYFRDDGFMAAVARAEAASQDFTLTTEPGRAAYIENAAARWVGVFEANCANPTFDPTKTWPGLLALALPMEP